MVKYRKHKKRFPCCKGKADLSDVLDIIDENQHFNPMSPEIKCPNCGKLIRVSLDIYDIEIVDDEFCVEGVEE